MEATLTTSRRVSGQRDWSASVILVDPTIHLFASLEWVGMQLASNPVFLTMHGMLTVSGNRRTAVKAIRAHSFGGPEVLQLETVEDPVAGPHEVVVDVRAAGVNPADTYMRNGTYAIRP